MEEKLAWMVGRRRSIFFGSIFDEATAVAAGEGAKRANAVGVG
jgi:hypothetical protein